jgi:hypothetical protein
MNTLAAITQRYGPDYQDKFNEKLLPSHRRALHDIAHCRTASFGGHLYQCPDCHDVHYQYHSCQNRHCPQCQHNAGQDWLAKQQALLLPVPYFMVTFTLPEALRRIARRHQRVVYSLLFRTAAAALKELAWDPRFVGGKIGMVSVLHTWGRNLSYHPHVHFLVPAGGLSADGHQWLRARHHFLVPVRALSRLFRAKFRDELRQTTLFEQLPADIWRSDWVVHCKEVGNGTHALKYLAPYIFRVAISNNRILNVADGRVTFRYRASDNGQEKQCTLTAEEFLRRFLQHVLPKGFVKVRYYGLFSPAQRHLLPLLRLWLDSSEPDCIEESDGPVKPAISAVVLQSRCEVRCPTCGQMMHHVRKIRPRPRCPP